MFSFIKDFKRIPNFVLLVIVAEFFLQLVNSSFLAILPLYMQKEGYSDPQIADATKYRYLGLLSLSLFIGLYIKGKKLKPFFLISAFFVPLFGISILFSIKHQYLFLNHWLQFLWGASFTCMQIPIIPYILRNVNKENQTAAISLSYSTWSFSAISGSAIIALLNGFNSILFSEEVLLYVICLISFTGLLLLLFVKSNETVDEKKDSFTLALKQTDWKIVLYALTPTLIVAIGAGFTIPFISLFFSNVHGLSTSQFSIAYFFASILVAGGALMIPKIKKNIGYLKAIPLTQSLAIIALLFMATTQYYNNTEYAVYIALFFFIIRQPLMNIAGPMTTEVTMGYVGNKNKEITSGLTAAIWSGSWFFSGILFGLLRKNEIEYVTIFLITVVLYTFGVAWYYKLVKSYAQKKNDF